MSKTYKLGILLIVRGDGPQKPDSEKLRWLKLKARQDAKKLRKRVLEQRNGLKILEFVVVANTKKNVGKF